MNSQCQKRNLCSLHTQFGQIIKTLRKEKGLARRDVAQELRIHVSSLAGWESGIRLPRDRHRLALARIFGCELNSLFPNTGNAPAPKTDPILVGTADDLTALLVELTLRTRKRIRALRLAAPYATTSYVQADWRRLVFERLQKGLLEVQRIEIFYDLRRLQEVVSNVLRYDGRPYYVKSFCAGLTEVTPSLGGYFFDDDEFLLGAYWTALPPTNRLGIRLSGPSYRAFFNDYWDEIWRRGLWLNSQGAHDLSAIRSVAERLGLARGDWAGFLDGARALRVGDGAPPLV